MRTSWTWTILLGVATACLKWRETKNCDPYGARNPSRDESCDKEIISGRSGYCECEHRKRAMEVPCEHHAFTCKEVCNSDENMHVEIPSQHAIVTCGSTLKLIHEDSRFRLHSHSVNYGSGSQQQSVTATGSRDDPNSYWLIKEGHDRPACGLGENIKCGDQIRLEHIATRRNLHTHDFQSPLSRNYEVSGFGVAGDGDRGDDWELICEESMQCSAESKCEEPFWKREALVRLKNVQTGYFLGSQASSRFDDNNCPRCPINGQQEVWASRGNNEQNLWFAGEGLYIAST